MAENTKIQWAHHTANLWWGCTEVHIGCQNCYAKALSNRYDGGNSLWGNDAPRRRIKSTFNDLDKYQRKANEAGEIHQVFVGSMMDIFEKPMPLLNPVDHYNNTDDLRQEFFTRINFDLYPNLLFLLLTKRPSNIHKYVPVGWMDEPPKNVMFGTSVVDQATADTLIPQLLKVPGNKFLSCEPLLGQIDIVKATQAAGLSWFIDCEIDWVIAGGESGHGARPMHPDWARSLRDQCAKANTPFFFKQWGAYSYIEKLPFKVDLISRVSHYWDDGFVKVNKKGPADVLNKFPLVCAVGKSESGHLLDGKVHHEFPILTK
jgi:protein gp37